MLKVKVQQHQECTCFNASLSNGSHSNNTNQDKITRSACVCTMVRIRIISIEATLKFVKNAVILIERAQSTAKVVMNRINLYWLRLLVHIPQLHSEIVSRQNVSATVTESNIRYRCYDL